MRLEKVKTGDVEKLLNHSFRQEKNIEYILHEGIYKGKSMIDPTQTHLNIASCSLAEIKQKYKEDLEQTYHKADSVVMYEGIITYPKDNPPKFGGVVLPPDEFFAFVIDALQDEELFGEHFKFYGGVSHKDEKNEHFHFYTACIDKLDKPITKVVGTKKVKKHIKSTGETKIVEQRIKKSYTQKYNAKKMMDREFFRQFHYMMEEALGKMGVEVELISKEVRDFNKFKNKLKAEYKESIEKADTVEEKKALVHEMFEILQSKDPKKTHKSIREMYVADFNKQLKEIMTEEQAKINALQQELIDEQEKYKKKKKSIITENENHITELEQEYQRWQNELDDIIQNLTDLHKEYEEEYANGLVELEAKVKRDLKAKYNEIYEKAYNEKMKEFMQSLGFSDKPSTFPAQEYDDRER